jgi:hypothetical protein
MITAAILYIFSKIISAFVYILPTWTFPTTFIDGLKFFLVGANQLNFLFPIYTLLQVAGFLISFEIVYYTARFISKLILKDRIDI